MLHSVALNDLRILAVTGSDRATFLQGQLTLDVADVRTDATSLAGWADAKGRLMFAGHVFRHRADGGDEALALLVPAETADALLKRMRMYVLRAKVAVGLLATPVHGLIGLPEGDATDGAIRILGEADRHLVPGETKAGTSCPRSVWQLADIRAGIPEITAATSGEFVPQMVNLDLLGGISFSKGCYTGQEIVARLKYRGKVKRRMLRFSATGAPPPAGSPLYASRGVVGQVLSSAPADSGAEFLAVVMLDDLPGPLNLDEAGARPVRQLELPYEVPLAADSPES